WTQISTLLPCTTLFRSPVAATACARSTFLPEPPPGLPGVSRLPSSCGLTSAPVPGPSCSGPSTRRRSPPRHPTQSPTSHRLSSASSNETTDWLIYHDDGPQATPTCQVVHILPPRLLFPGLKTDADAAHR